MVEKIISNLRDYRDIVLSAQSLVNEQFVANIKLLGIPEKEGNLFEQKLQNFQETVKKSLLSETEKKIFADSAPENVYRKAREIILQLTKKEIKDPLA